MKALRFERTGSLSELKRFLSFQELVFGIEAFAQASLTGGLRSDSSVDSLGKEKNGMKPHSKRALAFCLLAAHPPR
jgi:hypothetical protein